MITLIHLLELLLDMILEFLNYFIFLGYILLKIPFIFENTETLAQKFTGFTFTAGHKSFATGTVYFIIEKKCLVSFLHHLFHLLINIILRGLRYIILLFWYERLTLFDIK